MSNLSPEDRALLDRGAAGDVPTATDRDRIRGRLARLGVATGVGTAALATKTAAASAVTAAGLSLATKTVLVVLLGLAATAATVAATRPHAPPAPSVAPPRSPSPSPSSPPEPPASPTPALAAPPTPAPAASPTQELAASPTPALAASRTPALAASPSPSARVDALPSAPAPTTDALAEETRLLRDANAATRAGDAARALALLDEHAQRHPGGVLSEERDAERVLALCAAGQVAEAKRAATSFLHARPRSPLAGRVRGSCGGTSDRHPETL